mgnify:CR=1 FL=1
MDFKHIKVAVATQFATMAKYPLFRTAVTKDALWERYLSAFPAGTNPIVVAYLHDILEDTACTVNVLAALFEDNIVHAIVAITRVQGEDKDDYLAKVRANRMARIVKIHDSLCNLRASVMRFDSKRIRKYTEQIAYLASES